MSLKLRVIEVGGSLRMMSFSTLGGDDLFALSATVVVRSTVDRRLWVERILFFIFFLNLNQGIRFSSTFLHKEQLEGHGTSFDQSNKICWSYGVKMKICIKSQR